MAPLLLAMGSLSSGETSRFLMVLLPLKWVCIPYLLADLFDTFTKTLGVGYEYMTLCFYFIGRGLGTCGTITFSPSINLTGGLVKP